jgi:hypothetical protein
MDMQGTYNSHGRVMGAKLQFRRDLLGRCPRHFPRRGMSLLEVTLAAGLLGILMTVSVQMLRVMGDRQRAAERRIAALQTVQSLAEQIGNLRWDELTADAATVMEIPVAVARRLPGAQLRVTVREESEPIVAKRVMLELKWNGPRGQPVAPVRLTTWAFPESRLPD